MQTENNLSYARASTREVEAQQHASGRSAQKVAKEVLPQDLVNCLILSESVYKILDLGAKVATRVLERIQSLFPPGLATLESVQWSRPGVHHR